MSARIMTGAEIAAAHRRLRDAAPELYEALDAIVCYLIEGDFESATSIAKGDGLKRLAKARGEAL